MNPSFLVVLALGGLAASSTRLLAPPPAPAPLHCQIPCGIYGDSMRIDMLMEDAATIEKGMKTLADLQQESPVNYNQVVRWVANKDEHANRIQDMCLNYWLAQRIKVPQDAAGKEKYLKQLAAVHGIIVAAMKCKQTEDPVHVQKIRSLAMAFSETYFSGEDLQHIKEHHADH